MIAFRLDRKSGVPTYLQLVQQVEQATRAGFLQVGDQLPLIRDVVSTLAINPNTVHKAYRELELKGLVEGRPGRGTFVSKVGDTSLFATHAALRKSLRKWLATARNEGLEDADILALFQTTLHDMQKGNVA